MTDEKRIKEWNSGFMYKKGFSETKQFARYCMKLEEEGSLFLSKAVPAYDARSVSSQQLSVLLYDFFMSMFSDKDVKEEGLPDNCIDWRFNLLPLTHFSAWNMKDADKEVLRGWMMALQDEEMWINIYMRGLAAASIQFLHCMYIRKDDIASDNYCRCAMPENDRDRMLFVKLLMNVIWVQAYCTFVWAQQERVQKDFVNKITKEALDEAKNTIKKLEEELDGLKNETIPEYKRAISDAKTDKNNEISRKVGEVRKQQAEELSSERKKNKQLQSDLKSLQERYDALEEEMKIMNEAENDKDERRPESELNFESKIVFIVSPSLNGRMERTLENLSYRLPNSRFIYHADDITEGADCYVMLTKYMKHHSLYNSTRDLLSRRKWPYIHSNNQNVDLILDDIFMKNRYRGQ